MARSVAFRFNLPCDFQHDSHTEVHDHAVASHLVYDACFMAGLRNYRTDLGPAFRPRKVLFPAAGGGPVAGDPAFADEFAAISRVCR